MLRWPYSLGGIDLDARAETKNKYGLNVTRRYDGIVMLIFLEYSNLNDVSWDLRNIEYTIKVDLGTLNPHMQY